MRELSLFSGAGGGLLATKLLGFKAIGYVEWEPYCQAIIAQRIQDGFLEKAPIFGDIREFVKSGAAREYRGFADMVSAGFPCQPFSVAGKQAAEDDPRNMWPATRDVLCEVQPGYAFLENVAGLLATGYCETIFGDLAALGFDAKWGVFSGEECGAPHLRERIFIVANHREKRVRRDQQKAFSWESAFPWGKDGRGAENVRERSGISEPVIRRMGDGMASYVGRISALGNGQIPIVAAKAWQVLSQ